MTAADGITDWTYLCSLSDAVQKHKDAKTKPEVVAKAESFLKEIRSVVPPIPHGPDDEKAIEQVDTWREAIGKLLVDLQ